MVRRVTSPVLVGRASVMEQFDAAVTASMRGQPRHVIVSGEAGVGKTRLLQESRQRAEAMGARVLTGGCVSMGAEGLPFAPFTEVIRTLIAQGGVPAVLAAAGRAAPDLARLVPALDTGDPAPEQEQWAQARLYEALHDLLRRLADRQPLVVQLEDLHWADAGTLAATSYLLRAIHDEPVSVVATFRSDEVNRRHPIRPWLAEVVRSSSVERIELDPLDRDEVAALIGHILGSVPQDREVSEIHERADGNPFFVEELLCCRTQYDEGMPASLRDVLLSRVDAIPDRAKQLLGIAAVGGRQIEHEMLVAVAGGEEADDDLRILVDGGLLEPSHAPDGDDAYSFRHALLREVVYEDLLPTERRRLHRRWGQYLTDHAREHDAGVAPTVQLAHHLREARDERALPASIAAGDRAMASYSYDVASREYGEALGLWDEGAPEAAGTEHVSLLLRGARAAYLSSDYRRAQAWCREAIAELGDRDAAQRTVLLIQLARVRWVSGDWGGSMATYEEALRTAPDDPPVVRVRALAGLAQVYMLHGRLSEARTMCEAAIEAAVRIGARDLEGHVRNTLGVVLAGLGEPATALESIEQGLRLALELRIPDDIGRAYVNKSEILSWAGYPERAVETGLEGMRVAAEWGVANSYGAYIGYGAVSFAFEAGRWQEAMDILEHADRNSGSGDEGYVYRASYVSEILACRGDERFEPLWERASHIILERPPSDNHGLLFQGGIEHAAFAGEHELALRYARQVLGLLSGVDSVIRSAEVARVAAWPTAELGRAARAAGDAVALDAARAEFDRLEIVATAWQAAGVDRESRLAEVLRVGTLEELPAQRARLEGEDTAGQWAAVAESWAGLGRPFRVATARWRQAEAAERAGEREVAAAALRAAYEVAERLGALPLVAQLETIGRRLRVRLDGSGTSSAAPERAYGLTARELEVLAEVAAGRTNREIAERLFISESTAGVHVSNILGKLGVATRVEAGRAAREQSLVERAPFPGT